MTKNNLIILKIGGSVITDKENGRKIVKKNNLNRISREISEAKKKKGFSLVIVHGVGSFGHKLAKQFELSSGYKNKSQIKAISDLCADLQELNIEVKKHLKRNSINAITFQQSSAWILNNKKLGKFDLTIIKKYISLNLVPVLYGDVLIDSKLSFNILSGDKIIYYLAKELKAKKVIIGTDVDGVFDCDPKIYKNANLINEVNNKNINHFYIGKSTSTDVTGGMKGKVDELISLSKFGIESEIINISKPNILKKSLCGQKNIKTIIK
ncbi:MAG: isopentenyl phosphate kinase [Patescibacteria group bacterium]|nr:isopentenyl phosphate kinase [Patescibacteria group bacterium]